MSSHSPRRRLLLRTTAACGLACSTGPLLHAQTRPALRVAVVPQFPAADLHRDWTPLLDHLGHQVGATLQLVLLPTIPRFEAEVMAGNADFAYMNPYHQVMARQAQGYVPVVRGRAPLSGILVARRDAALPTLQALAGQTLAFPSPNAFGASLWMRALLTEREKINFTPRYVQTHSNVYRQVMQGTVAAGGGVNLTLAQESNELRQELRVLFETPGVPPHPLSAHPRVEAPLRQAVAEAMLALGSTAHGLAMLRAVEMEGVMRADHARDYQPLEAYRLDRYVVK